MKRLTLGVVSASLLLCSFSAFADKVVIKGEPVVVEKRGDVYYVPEDYRATADYYYVTVDGARKVCYAERQPNISLEVTPLSVDIGGKRAVWNCYTYDETYFTVAP